MFLYSTDGLTRLVPLSGHTNESFFEIFDAAMECRLLPLTFRGKVFDDIGRHTPDTPPTQQRFVFRS